MIRRCIESSKPTFGMVLPARGTGPGGLQGVMEYGTMLEIQSVQMLPDGRSMVETVGTHRFRLLEKGNLDGYTVGRTERCVRSVQSKSKANVKHRRHLAGRRRTVARIGDARCGPSQRTHAVWSRGFRLGFDPPRDQLTCDTTTAGTVTSRRSGALYRRIHEHLPVVHLTAGKRVRAVAAPAPEQHVWPHAY